MYIVAYKFGCIQQMIEVESQDRLAYFTKNGFWVTQKLELALLENDDAAWMILPHMITGVEKVKDEVDE